MNDYSVENSKIISANLENSLIKPALSRLGIVPNFYYTSRIQWCGNYHNFTLCIDGPTSHTIEKIIFGCPSQADSRFALFAYVDRGRNMIQSLAVITLSLLRNLLIHDSDLTYTRYSSVDNAVFRAITFENVDTFASRNGLWKGHFRRFI